ncbi:MAG: type III pantothenate kinase [gamma proteobacterium symbiont of Ctena orbiculata]|nr:type III pantothenate kinase [Candidatus Thiodiazotropha taylori]MBT3060031.1 type III pantothenate kinase [Candidatus Thiodiazotropha sp. (ex Lucina pensylvanica)]MBV2093494.1 type III pantothenate kinase [Candidatus Thiodiazotropha sp. (ex Codakia orbicularis)]PUB71872.1 MAG: type III pantothenate kinase [gamma proteobacterium symbiont of Ctena orbiculata]MBT3062297.1 type III pantothenate kinase [Candidatus Thiodiazotropha sp. (ex Lucina pensylvanica)]
MNLYVDIGNTAIKWATELELERGDLHQAQSADLPKAIEKAWLELVRPDGVHIASVRRQQVDLKLLQWIEREWGIEARFAETRRQEHGVTNGYRQPGQLGVDRWLALIAARALSPSAQIVVDCGSATTIDAMDDEGRHIGGIILPGKRLLADALRQNTDIPPHDEGVIRDYFAADTASGILTGAVVAQCATVEKLYQMLQQRETGEVRCVVTGGDAGFLSAYLELPHEVVPGLVLMGLQLQSSLDA